MPGERRDDLLLESHIREEMERYGSIDNRLDAIEGQMRELLDTWVQAKGAFSFVKVMAGLGAAAAAIWAFVSDHFHVALK